jgi:hypothetical protein
VKRLLAALTLAVPALAHAGSWFQFEAGAGYAFTKDLGDGTWYQEGVPHAKTLNTKALLAGVTGELYMVGHADLSYHADYVWFGTQRASCLCVTDEQYNATTHTAAVPGYIPFNSSGHVQGVSFTLEPGYTWRGVRFAVEAGPWVFWDTWHVHRVDPAQPGVDDLSRKTKAQLGWVAGARVESGNYSVSYRYYKEPQDWSTGSPGIANGTHMLMFVGKF